MGQHKTNPTAIKAKAGEIPPKKKPLSKRERERIIQAQIMKMIFAPLSERCNDRLEMEVKEDGKRSENG